MDNIEKISRFCLVASDQSYQSQVAVDGSVSLAPYPDSLGNDLFPNTMPPSFIDPVLFAITPHVRPLEALSMIDCDTNRPLRSPDPVAAASFVRQGREGNSYPLAKASAAGKKD
jgi:hypothetical protein